MTPPAIPSHLVSPEQRKQLQVMRSQVRKVNEAIQERLHSRLIRAYQSIWGLQYDRHEYKGLNWRAIPEFKCLSLASGNAAYSYLTYRDGTWYVTRLAEVDTETGKAGEIEATAAIPPELYIGSDRDTVRHVRAILERHIRSENASLITSVRKERDALLLRLLHLDELEERAVRTCEASKTREERRRRRSRLRKERRSRLRKERRRAAQLSTISQHTMTSTDNEETP